MTEPAQTPRRKPAVFLERQGYRRRRVADAARAVPFVGLVLWLIPLLWQESGPGAQRSSQAIIYLFGTWALLVALSVAIAQVLQRRGDVDEDSGDAS